MEHWNLSKGKILIICYYCILWNRVSNDKAPVEECSSEFGERSELAWLVDSQSVPGNHLQFQHWFLRKWVQKWEERKSTDLERIWTCLLIFSIHNRSECICGGLWANSAGEINRMLVKTGKGAKYFYWVLKRTTENEIYLLLMHLIWQNDCTTGFQQKKNTQRQHVK